jgi:hypothetical protein
MWPRLAAWSFSRQLPLENASWMACMHGAPIPQRALLAALWRVTSPEYLFPMMLIDVRQVDNVDCGRNEVTDIFSLIVIGHPATQSYSFVTFWIAILLRIRNIVLFLT